MTPLLAMLAGTVVSAAGTGLPLEPAASGGFWHRVLQMGASRWKCDVHEQDMKAGPTCAPSRMAALK